MLVLNVILNDILVTNKYLIVGCVCHPNKNHVHCNYIDISMITVDIESFLATAYEVNRGLCDHIVFVSWLVG